MSTATVPDLDTVIATALAEGRDVLFESEAGPILEAFGVAAPQQIFVAIDDDPREAAFEACGRFGGTRAVVKVVASGILHKTELGGVRIVEKRAPVLTSTIDAMRLALAAHRPRGFLLCEFVEHDAGLGGELLVGMRWTPDFGPVVTFGAGGVNAELLSANLIPGREVAVFSPALTAAQDIDQILEGKTIAPLVTGGIRNQRARMPAGELRALIERMLAFAAEYVPNPIRELEINPLVPTSSGPVALDILVRLNREAVSAVEIPPRPLAKIGQLLRPRSIAVAGVSKSLNPGRIIVNNLIHDGFDRQRIWIVKPGALAGETIEGCRCVPDLDALPEPVDLLVLSIAAEQVPDAIERVTALRKAESVIIIPGGLGEHPGSENLAERIRDAVRRSRSTEWRGPVLNGANCLGVQSRPGRVNTVFLPPHKLQPLPDEGRPAAAPLEAPLAFVSQSGAFAIAKATELAGRTPRYLISIGNQIDLTVGDYLDYLAFDPEVEVFAFYVEGFRPLDGLRWLEAASRVVNSGRPVVLYAAGRTQEGARASASHTAAIAGDAVVTRELATAAGVLVADTLEEFEDLVRVTCLLRDRKVAGLRLAAMSNAGFESVAFADNAGAFSFSRPGDATRRKIADIITENRLDRIVTIDNPLDVNPLLGDRAFAEVARALLEDDGFDAGIIGCVPLTGSLQTLPAGADHAEDLTSGDSVVSRLVELWNTTSKPWVAVVDGGPRYDAMARRLERGGIPTFRTADRALRVLGRWCSWSLRHRA